MSNLEHLLTTTKTRLKQFLEPLLPASQNESYPNALNAAMRYSVFSNGKNLRPALVYATGRVLNIPEKNLDAAAASLELIHCYSLIHDDLPAMDDDDLRRGKPTCHKKFNEAIAILAGDALQTMAFEILSNPELNPISANSRINMVQTLACAAGSNGMVLGQAEDISAENKQLTLAELSSLHKRKTGALLTAGIKLALCANENENFIDIKTSSNLCTYAYNIGLAFQILDDVLDVTANTDILGKPAGSDQKHGKSTFPAIMGLEQAQQYAESCHKQALDALTNFDNRADILREISYFFINRKF